MILSEIEKWLAAHDVGRRGEERVVVACSGGRDSVVLAHATVELLGGRRVVLGHVDHGVREGSNEDAAAVCGLAAAMGARAVVEEVAPRTDAEAELRRVRYEALASIRSSAGAALTMTAHTLDDQAETILLQLIRTGCLEGILRWRDPILRPLLDVPREVIARYATRHRLRWRSDPSNLEPRYLRNRIRKELLPLLERRYRPRIRERLAGLVGATRSEIDPPNVAVGSGEPPPVEVSVVCADWSGGPIPDGRGAAAFDAAVLRAPVMRRFRSGDRIQPFGMTGRTKVAEVLRAAGVPAAVRTKVTVVVDAEDRVIWVPGVVRSGYAPITDTTMRAWIMTVRETGVLRATESRVTLEAAGEGLGETHVSSPRNDS